jgi:transposase-like protein
MKSQQLPLLAPLCSIVGSSGQVESAYPGEDAFLDTLFEVRFGKPTCPRCRQVGKFRRRHKQKVYSCVACWHEIRPLVGTIFEGSKTPFSTWLAAIELVHVFNASAKDIQRQTGVTYETAWRMKKLLQELAAPRYGSTADLKGLVQWLTSQAPLPGANGAA